MRKIYSSFIIVVLSFIYSECFSQTFTENILFSNHLTTNNEIKEAIGELKNIDTQNLTISQSDTLNYKLGFNYYLIKKMDSSIFYLNKVSSSFSQYKKSKFYESFGAIYLAKYEQSEKTLSELELDTNLLKVKNLHLAGISLLKRDYTSFDKLTKNMRFNYFPIIEEEKSLINYKKAILKNKKKSMFLAGTMSAIIPGSGKFYAGFKGQAFGTFFPVAITGIVAAENLYRGGYKSAGFIFFGSLFSIFYLGNIWGSAISVKVYREERYEEFKNKIMLDMHIPLRNIFN